MEMEIKDKRFWSTQCPAVDGMQEPGSRCLTPSLSSALSPRFTPDRERIIFLSHSAAASSGAHNATAALCSLPWPCERSPHPVSGDQLLHALSPPYRMWYPLRDSCLAHIHSVQEQCWANSLEHEQGLWP